MVGMEMSLITIKDLSHILLKAWNADTAKGEWIPECPSLNQCAVTALIVQDYFGGKLMRQALDDGDSHYWNRLPNGQEIDLTFEQFSYTKQKGIGEVIIRDRHYVLSYPDTSFRYQILKERVDKLIREKEY